MVLSSLNSKLLQQADLEKKVLTDVPGKSKLQKILFRIIYLVVICVVLYLTEKREVHILEGFLGYSFIQRETLGENLSRY